MIKLDNIRRLYMITDLHFGVRNNSLAWRDTMVDFFDWFIDDIKKNGFDSNQDALMILGDVFNSRESINLMILENALSIFDKLSYEFPNGIHLITGNHDAYYVDNNGITSVSLLDRILSKVNGYYEPTQIILNGSKCLILPWITDFSKIHEILKNDDSDYLFCHMDINGMKYSSGINIEKSVDVGYINKYKHVYSGHIHIRQTNNNVTYLGTPYQLDAGDINNIKGYHYIDINDGFKLHFFENKISPVFKLVNIYNILNSTVDDVHKNLNNNYIDVLCDIHTYTNIDLILFRKQLQDLGINFKKMSFSQYEDLNEDDSDLELTMDSFSFDILDSSKSLLKNNKKTDGEIEDIMSYFINLYNNTKNILVDGVK